MFLQRGGTGFTFVSILCTELILYDRRATTEGMQETNSPRFLRFKKLLTKNYTIHIMSISQRFCFDGDKVYKQFTSFLPLGRASVIGVNALPNAGTSDLWPQALRDAKYVQRRYTKLCVDFHVS
jgi:hypothetical protein